MSHNDASTLDALAANQNTTRDMIHEIDTNDVAISREALSALGNTARSLLSKVLGAGNATSLPLAEVVKMFASKLYWNEAGGELLMCAEIGGQTLCLPIPAEHWNVSHEGQFQ